MKYTTYTFYADTSCYRAHVLNRYRYLNLGPRSGQRTWSKLVTDYSGDQWRCSVTVPDTLVLIAVGELPK